MDLMLTLNKTVDRFPMASSVHWFGYALDVGHVLTTALNFKAECQCWKSEK